MHMSLVSYKKTNIGQTSKYQIFHTFKKNCNIYQS